MKIYNKVGFLMVFLYFSTLNADEFGDVNALVEGAGKSIQATGGVGIKAFLAWATLILPIIGVIGGIWIEKKKSENSQDNSKIYIAGIVGAVLAVIIDVIVISVFGVLLLGSAQDGFSVVRNYWKEALL
ncbi:hypothetical protein CCZ01_09190 [Helicobacter monodelphidis]|uniref:hypothetical protein n=1 Tax=Helicobacter sp. 15-1451 TaxID=2004995 RepID=UPI000DCF2B4A|nr:hypothetical protein [Helicobacter sp. 15-1451]RAX56538.1 hypothetical protein CCZ01_09190 [Helicobacter sp. 15-1451]